MLEDKLTITMTEAEALDLSVIIAGKQADLLHKKCQGEILEWHELRISGSLSSVSDKIDRELMKIHTYGWTPAEDMPPLQLVRDGKKSD